MLQHTGDGYARQLTRRQREALPHLIAPGSVSERTRNAGISRQTFYRWLGDVDFRRRLQEACDDAMSLADAQMQLASHQAVATIFQKLEHEKPHISLRAAQIIVEMGRDSRSDQQIVERLDAIENAAHFKEESKSAYP